MATLSWLLGVDGNWKLGANWNGGTAPTASDDVVINADGFGTGYTVSLTKPGFANSLTINNFFATFSQSADAPLTVTNTLSVDGGVVILRAANSFGSVTISFGTIEIANDQAFGSAQVVNDSLIEAISSVTLANAVVEQGGGDLAAVHGKTLTLTGPFTAAANATLEFGTLSGADGFVVMAPSTISVGSSISLLIYGTLRAGNLLAGA